MVKVFFDCETTGVNPKLHSIHQLAGLIEVDGVVVETFNIKLRPHHNAKIEAEALKVCNVTLEQIMAYEPQELGYKQFIKTIEKYVNKYDNKDKAYLVGYNNRFFDDVFLRMFFELNGNPMIGAYFWNNTLDVLVLSTQYLLERRLNMPSFKLRRVAKELGLWVKDESLHDALYDVELTREIYKIVTGLEIEL